MIRREVVEAFEARFHELAYSDPAAALQFAEDEWPEFTPEEQGYLERRMMERGDEAFRAGEEALEAALPPEAPPEVRRGLLAAGYRGYRAMLDRLTGGASSGAP